MGCTVQRRELAGMGDGFLPTDPIQIPEFAIDPTLLMIGGGLLFLALFLKKGEPARARKRATKARKRSRIEAARQVLAEEGGGGYF